MEINSKALPFWSWNYDMQPEEINRQIKDFADKNYGGFFIHARAGLLIEYMSEKWFECVDVAIQTAKKLNLKVWLYDENGWPSGSANKIVPLISEEYTQKWMDFEFVKIDKTIDYKNTICFYKKNGETFIITKIDEFNENDDALRIFYQENEIYTDLLNEDAVKEFIKHSHNRYYERYSHEFGDTIAGIFTDEPQLAEKKFPWSVKLICAFFEENNSNLIEILPELLLKNNYKYLHDFWKTVVKLFVNAYTKQIGNWCENRNIYYTGHMSMENGLCMQMAYNGGVMPHYKYMQIPGIDHLGNKISSPVLPKQADSVARQYNKKYVISEMFGCSGWDMSFADFNYISNWQYVLGVGLSTQHIAAYTIAGCRKRDYPPAISYQLSWWEKFGEFNKSTYELLEKLNNQNDIVDVLVIHPITSGWCLYKDTDKLEQISNNFRQISEWLCELQIAYHYGDEMIIAEDARVDEKTLVIGSQSYNTIIVPPMASLEGTTYNLLREYMYNGGRVIFISPIAYMINGVENDAVLKLAKNGKCSCKKKYLNMALECIEYKRIVQCKDKYGKNIDKLYTRVQSDENKVSIFVANIDRLNSFKTEIEIKKTGNIKVFDTVYGEIDNYIVQFSDKKTILSLNVEKGRGYVIEISNDISIAENLKIRKINETVLYNDWQINKSDLNLYTIDTCRYRVGNYYSERMPVIMAQEKLCLSATNADVDILYDFDMKDKIIKQINELFIVIEKSQALKQVKINGQNINVNTDEWWCDKYFSKINILPYITNGNNQIIATYSFVNNKMLEKEKFETERNLFFYDTEIENVYLLGDFGVVSKDFRYGKRETIVTDGNFRIVPKTSETKGNLTKDGYLFFNGKIQLRNKFTLKNKTCVTKVKINDMKVCIGELYINKYKIADISCFPHEFDISNYVIQGENEIELVLWASNRNAFGPNHHYRHESEFVGPSSYQGVKEWIDHDYFNTPDNILIDEYAFALFGIYNEISVVSYKTEV